MVKRKRGEPRLEENLQKWEKDLVRGLKTAKGFERQRLSKRIREAANDTSKAERLEREVMVLKSLDLHQAAHQHLCSSILKIKGIAASPNLPDFIKPVPKVELTEDERTALHNVTSALCNRKQVKDIIDEAIMGTCIALRVPMPEKKGKGKGGSGTTRKEQENQPDDIEKKTNQPAAAAAESAEENKTSKAKASKKGDVQEQKDESEGENSWGGFSSGAEDDKAQDSAKEEKKFSRFEHMLGSSSDDEGDGNESDGDQDMEDSRARSIRGPSDYFSGSEDDEGDDEPDDMDIDDISGDEMSENDDSEEEEEEEDDDDDDEDSDSDSNSPLRPLKKAKTSRAQAKAAAASTSRGNSTFLPSLMGGYISGSESEASDVDVAPPVRKNRRGQKARQAIWEKKYKEKANHLKAPPKGRDQGWDPKRGAVDGESAGPWKRGIRNPFAKPPPAEEGVHPDRQANFGPQDRNDSKPTPHNHNGDRKGNGKGRPRSEDRPQRGPPNAARSQPRSGVSGGGDDWASSSAPNAPVPPKPKPKPKRDDEGPLHASWEAAKRAKEAAQKVAFQGKKVVFD